MAVKGLRLLWMANAPWAATGYGVQSKSLLPRAITLDCIDDIGIFAFYGVQGGLTRQKLGKRWFDCYPLRSNPWGNDVAGDHAAHFGAHAIITLMDIWVLDQNFGRKGFRWIPYMPIDHDPIPKPIYERMRLSYIPITYSRFGWEQAQSVGIDSYYIPHGVETRIFHPLSLQQRRACKKWLGFDPDDFVVGIVAANKGWPSRKSFPEMMEAFRALNRKHSDAKLYLHSLTTQEMGGPDLLSMCQSYGIHKHTRFVDPYLTFLGFNDQEMNRVYNSFDVLLMTTMAEGFGIPLIEAQACGVPVITSSWTSMPELCGAGWTVGYREKFYTPLGSWQFIPDVADIAEALDQAYDKRGDEELRSIARQFALNYDWDVVFEQGWKPFFNDLWQQVQNEANMTVYQG